MKTKRLDLRLGTAPRQARLLSPESFRADCVSVLPDLTADMLRVTALRARIRTFRFPDPVIPDGASSPHHPTPQLVAPHRRRATQIESSDGGLSLRDRVFYA